MTKEDAIGFTVLVLTIVILTAIINSCLVTRQLEQKAIRAGVGYYQCNPTNGAVTFIYTNQTPKL